RLMPCITSFGMMRKVHGLPGSVTLMEEEPALSSGTLASSTIGMTARVASEHSSPMMTSGLNCSISRLAACVAGSGPQLESSYWTANLKPFTPALLSCSSASSTPCLSCAPKYEPGPDMGNSAPILMVLSCACAAEPIATRPIAAALTKRVRNAFMLSSPHRFSLGQSLSTNGLSRKATYRRVPDVDRRDRVGFSDEFAVHRRAAWRGLR